MEIERDQVGLDDLPDEVLEFILSLVSPYKDLDNCKSVNKRWRKICKSVCYHAQNNLYRSIKTSNIVWTTLGQQESPPSITKRYSHSACYVDGKLYVFGGCTSTCTTFNDLWTLDLTTRIWSRPVTTGSYPSPKASASMINYNNNLILFGGWTHPSPYPLHQALRLFNEVHEYDIVSNRWTRIHFPHYPPQVAGHSATLHGNMMVMFGGLKTRVRDFGCSNEVWCLDLVTMNWTKQATSEPGPPPRYGQSQIIIDEHNILILGGSNGLHFVHEDIWLLTLTDSIWQWTKINIVNSQWAAPHIWCHSATKVKDLVVIFSKRLNSSIVERLYRVCSMRKFRSSSTREDNGGIPADVIARQASSCAQLTVKDEKSDVQQHGSQDPQPSTSRSCDVPNIPRNESQDMGAGPSVFNNRRCNRGVCMCDSCSHEDSMLAFRDTTAQPPSVFKNRSKQLEQLNKYQEKYKNMKEEQEKQRVMQHHKTLRQCHDQNSMCMYVLDVSHVLDQHVVTWLQPDVTCVTPRDSVFHSISLGRGEIVLFGGVLRDPTTPSDTPAVVSNTVHLISSQRNII